MKDSYLIYNQMWLNLAKSLHLHHKIGNNEYRHQSLQNGTY
jgi:hypothetical protein